MVTRSELLAFLATAGSASGSVGAYTVSRNRAGPFVRDRVTPVQPGTLAQVLVQDRWSVTGNIWRDQVTPAEKASWIDYAADVPLRNRLGSVRHITGFQHWIRANTIRRVCNLPQINPAPRIHALAQWTSIEPKVTANPARGVLRIAWLDQDAFASEPGSIVYVYATVAYPPTITSFKPPMKFKVCRPGIQIPPIVVPLANAAAVGDHVFVRTRMQRLDGRLSGPYNYRVTVIP